MSAEELAVQLSDASKSGRIFAEVTHLHLFHHPNDKRDVNGFNVVIRIADREFTLSAREGVVGAGVDLCAAVPYESGGKAYQKLVMNRHEQFAEVQTALLSVAERIMHLFDDIRDVEDPS